MAGEGSAKAGFRVVNDSLDVGVNVLIAPILHVERVEQANLGSGVHFNKDDGGLGTKMELFGAVVYKHI